MNGKTRDFCNANPFLHEKTRHSHKAAIRKDCKNAYKNHLVFRKPCKHAYKKIRRALKFRVRSKAEGLPDKENPGPMPLPGKKSDAPSNSGCGLRPKAYNTKRTLGPGPYREKYARIHTIHDICKGCKQK